MAARATSALVFSGTSDREAGKELYSSSCAAGVVCEGAGALHWDMCVHW
jgi:hypothetical protein